jgi:hypothetical protein
MTKKSRSFVECSDSSSVWSGDGDVQNSNSTEIFERKMIDAVLSSPLHTYAILPNNDQEELFPCDHIRFDDGIRNYNLVSADEGSCRIFRLIRYCCPICQKSGPLQGQDLLP